MMNNKQFTKLINIERTILGCEQTIPKQVKYKDFFHEKIKEIVLRIKWFFFPKRVAVYALIYLNGKIAIIKNKSKQIIWIWWKVEKRETNRQTIKRELREETTLDINMFSKSHCIKVNNPFKVFREGWEEKGWGQHIAVQYFFVIIVSNKFEKHYLKNNKYIDWMPITDILNTINYQPYTQYFSKNIYNIIIKYLK